VGQLIKCNEDYYKTLGISRNASPQEVKKAYRKLSQKYHPDLNRAKDASDMFSKINNAYEILSDKEKRRRFD
jgi:DnaJ-class molecular chaperone